MTETVSVWRERIVTYTIVVLVTLIFAGMLGLAIWLAGDPRAAILLLYRHCVVIGLLSPALIFAFAALESRVGNRAPFFGVSWTAPWWHLLVFALTVGLLAPLLTLATMGTLIILPFVVPVKVLTEYAFGAQANLVSAIASVPILVLSLSVVFCIAYGMLGRRGMGTIEVEGASLIEKPPDGVDVPELFRFSFLTMLGASVNGSRTTGACRWVEVVQITAARMLEVVVVAVAIGIIVNRMSGGD